MTKPESLKLQVAYQVFPETREERVLRFLLDRDRTTSTDTRLKVLSALLAWLDVDALQSERDTLSDRSYEQALLLSLAELKSRVTYVETLLRGSNGSVGDSPESPPEALSSLAEVAPVAARSPQPLPGDREAASSRPPSDGGGNADPRDVKFEGEGEDAVLSNALDLFS